MARGRLRWGRGDIEIVRQHMVQDFAAPRARVRSDRPTMALARPTVTAVPCPDPTPPRGHPHTHFAPSLRLFSVLSSPGSVSGSFPVAPATANRWARDARVSIRHMGPSTPRVSLGSRLDELSFLRVQHSLHVVHDRTYSALRPYLPSWCARTMASAACHHPMATPCAIS